MNSSSAVPAPAVSPSTPVLEQVAMQAAATIASPTPEMIVADIQVALKLFLDFKTSLNGLHPSVWNVIQFLI